MTSKKPNKTAKTVKKEKAKTPDTIYVIIDEFNDIDYYRSDVVGFLTDKIQAEKYRTDRQEEMTKGLAMFMYHQNKYFFTEIEKEIEDLEKLMNDHCHFEDYSKTIIKEVKQIK